jgi:hypothetical protein
MEDGEMTKEQRLYLVAICISIVALLILLISVAADRSHGSELPKESCGRWVKVNPTGEGCASWLYDGKFSYGTMFEFCWSDSTEPPDFVFVPEKCEEKAETLCVGGGDIDSEILYLRYCLGGEREDYADSVCLIVHYYLVSDTACWHWEESSTWNWPLLDLCGDTVWVTGAVKRKIVDSKPKGR